MLTKIGKHLLLLYLLVRRILAETPDTSVYQLSLFSKFSGLFSQYSIVSESKDLTGAQIKSYIDYYISKGDEVYERIDMRFTGINGYSFIRGHYPGFTFENMFEKQSPTSPSSSQPGGITYEGGSPALRSCVGSPWPSYNWQNATKAQMERKIKICNGNEVYRLQTNQDSSEGRRIVVMARLIPKKPVVTLWNSPTTSTATRRNRNLQTAIGQTSQTNGSPSPPQSTSATKNYLYKKEDLKCGEQFITYKDFLFTGCLANKGNLFVIAVVNMETGAVKNYHYNNNYDQSKRETIRTTFPFFFYPIASPFEVAHSQPRMYFMVRPFRRTSNKTGFFKLYRFAYNASTKDFDFQNEIIHDLSKIPDIRKKFSMNWVQPLQKLINVTRYYPFRSLSGRSNTYSRETFSDAFKRLKKIAEDQLVNSNPIATSMGLLTNFENPSQSYSSDSYFVLLGQIIDPNNPNMRELVMFRVELQKEETVLKVNSQSSRKINYNYRDYGSFVGGIPLFIPQYYDDTSQAKRTGMLILITNKMILRLRINSNDGSFYSYGISPQMYLPCEFGDGEHVRLDYSLSHHPYRPFLALTNAGVYNESAPTSFDHALLINLKNYEIQCVNNINAQFFYPETLFQGQGGSTNQPKTKYLTLDEYNLKNNQIRQEQQKSYGMVVTALNSTPNSNGLVTYTLRDFNYLRVEKKDKVKTSVDDKNPNYYTQNILARGLAYEYSSQKDGVWTVISTRNLNESQKALDQAFDPRKIFFVGETSIVKVGWAKAGCRGCSIAIANSSEPGLVKLDYFGDNSLSLKRASPRVSDGSSEADSDDGGSYDQLWPLNQGYLLVLKPAVSTEDQKRTPFFLFKCEALLTPAVKIKDPSCVSVSSGSFDAANRTINAFTLDKYLILVFSSSRSTSYDKKYNIMRGFDIKTGQPIQSLWVALTTNSMTSNDPENTYQMTIHSTKVDIGSNNKSAIVYYSASSINRGVRPAVFYMEVSLLNQSRGQEGVYFSVSKRDMAENFPASKVAVQGRQQGGMITNFFFTKTISSMLSGVVPTSEKADSFKAFYTSSLKNSTELLAGVNSHSYNRLQSGVYTPNQGFAFSIAFQRSSDPRLSRTVSARGLITCISNDSILYYRPFEKVMYLSSIENGKQRSVVNIDLSLIKKIKQTECLGEKGIFQALVEYNNGAVFLLNYQLAQIFDKRTQLHSKVDLPSSTKLFRSFSSSMENHISTIIEDQKGSLSLPIRLIRINPEGPDLFFNTTKTTPGQKKFTMIIETPKYYTFLVQNKLKEPFLNYSYTNNLPPDSKGGNAYGVSDFYDIQGPVVDV